MTDKAQASEEFSLHEDRARCHDLIVGLGEDRNDDVYWRPFGSGVDFLQLGEVFTVRGFGWSRRRGKNA